mmetsp:Transcript_23152/g.54179  ORF Transcript_23152/g.54179 Transcript_23152/m.54179 type:complete len:313 (-) Transcript_23152:11-949(-)
MAAEWLMRERWARLRDELEAQRSESKFPAVGVGSGDAAALEELRQELKRKKFCHLSVEAQLCFIGSCQEGNLDDSAAKSKELEGARQVAKARNQALRRELAREAEEHSQLLEQRGDLHREALRQFQECEQLVRELQGLLELEDAEEAELAAEVAELASSPVEELALGLAENQEDLVKRRRLEYERQMLERHRQAPEASRSELAQLEAYERREIERLEAFERTQCELGLPQLVIHDGAVVLNGPAVGPASEELRTVHVERDASHRLRRVEAHASLGLQEECALCVEGDDLARLLTLVWDCLCERSRAVELGGA